MSIIADIFVIGLGLIIGSFLNVLILRHNTGLSAMKGQSVCFSCGKTLRWFELIPVLSFLALRGRCARCQTKISWQYPLVEALTSLLFWLVWWKLDGLSSPVWQVFLTWAFFAVLVVVSVYDIKHKIIPDEYSIILGVISLILVLGQATFLHLQGRYLLWAFLAGPILASPFALIFLVSRGRWMGFGDVKLELSLGWFLGIWAGLSAMFLSFWTGAIYGVLAVLLGLKLFKQKITIKSEVPFAPFLILGCTLIYFFGWDLLHLSWFVN